MVVRGVHQVNLLTGKLPFSVSVRGFVPRKGLRLFGVELRELGKGESKEGFFTLNSPSHLPLNEFIPTETVQNQPEVLPRD